MLEISTRESEAGKRSKLFKVSSRALRVTVGIIEIILLSACGVFGAEGKAKSPAASSHKTVVVVAAAEIVGRWSGNYYGFGSHRETCAGSGCTITLDISACATGWCGVRVKDDGGCGGVAMSVTTAEARPNAQKFTGKLDLVSGAEAYTIEATMWKSQDEPAKRFLNLIGDTGPELRFMRRSFPFEAALSRSGDATCVSDKPVS